MQNHHQAEHACANSMPARIHSHQICRFYPADQASARPGGTPEACCSMACRHAYLLRMGTHSWQMHHDEQISRRAGLAAAQAMYEKDLPWQAADFPSSRLTSNQWGQASDLPQQVLSHSRSLQDDSCVAGPSDMPIGHKCISLAGRTAAPAPPASIHKRPSPMPFLPLQPHLLGGAGPAVHQHDAEHAVWVSSRSAQQLHTSPPACQHTHGPWREHGNAKSEVLRRNQTQGTWSLQAVCHTGLQKPSPLLQRLADLRIAADATLNGSQFVEKS